MTDLEPIHPERAVEYYLDDRRGEVAPNTIKAHRQRLAPFLEWLEERDITNLNVLTGRLIKEYQIEERNASNWATTTEKSMMCAVRVFIRWCESIEAVDNGLAERVQNPSLANVDDVRHTELVSDTAEAVLTNLGKYHYCSLPHVTLAVMWHTMCRVGAVRSLDLEDYDPDDAYLQFVHRPETGTPLKNKQGSERYVALAADITDLLDDWIADQRLDVTDEYGREPLFTTENGRVGTGTIQGYAYKYTQPCRYNRRCPVGRNPNDCEATEHGNISKCPESVSPHPFRRGSITHWLRSDVPSRAISDRADVSERVIDKHYDERTDQEKMEQRRDFLGEV